jgi:serine/threonine protein phosphatase PrpC
MKISISEPKYFWEIGGRANNEDFLYPKSNAQVDNLFLVCDGVGGAAKGEVASQMTCENIVKFFLKKPTKVSTENYINEAIRFAEERLNDYFVVNPDSKGLATTLTLLHLHEAGATIAHVGDSRVYQVRDGKIVFKTKDHNLINELLEQGVITEAEAQTHPKRNVITRALQADPENFTYPSVFHTLDDVKAGDYFFLCSDGVIEHLTDAMLQNILSSKDSDAQKLTKIKEKSVPHAKDNCTAYLIHVSGVEGNVSSAHLQLIDTEKRTFTKTADVHSDSHYVVDAVMGEPLYPDYHNEAPAFAPNATFSPQASPLKQDYKQYFKYAMVVLVMTIGGFLGINYFNSEKPKVVEKPVTSSIQTAEPKPERNRPVAVPQSTTSAIVPPVKKVLTNPTTPSAPDNTFNNAGPPVKDPILEAAEKAQGNTNTKQKPSVSDGLKEAQKLLQRKADGKVPVKTEEKVAGKTEEKSGVRAEEKEGIKSDHNLIIDSAPKPKTPEKKNQGDSINQPFKPSNK